MKDISELILRELSSSLEKYLDEECVNMLAQFFSSMLGPITSVIVPKITEFESGKDIPSRKFMQELELEFKKALDSTNIPNQIGNCFVKLLKSDWFQEEVPKIMESVISEQLKNLKKYEESEILLDIFYKACENNLNLVFNSWYRHYPTKQQLEEFMYKLFDGIRSLQQTTQFEEDFETQAILVLSSFQILSEAYYKRLISFLLDCMEVIEGGSPKGEIKYIGQSYRNYKIKYKEKYPNAEVFYNRIIKDIRNSMAHADYEIDAESREIIVKDMGKILHRLNEDKIKEVFEYLIKMVNISIHFYWYSLLYFAKKLNFWNLIFNEIEKL